MALFDQLQNDMKAAMRAGEKQRVEVIRMAIAALKNAQIAQVKESYDAAAAAGNDDVTVDRTAAISDEVAQQTLTKEVKRRREAAAVYRQGKREDLAELEDQEAAILETYLPKQLTADELRPQVAALIAEVGAAGPADMNKVMPVAMQRFKGRADGRILSQLVRELLAN